MKVLKFKKHSDQRRLPREQRHQSEGACGGPLSPSVFSVFLFKLFAWDCETEMVKNARWERGLWGKDAL